MDDIQVIQGRIHEIRGVNVMLDFDLAELYQVETRVLKQAVRRNADRFPDDFMFQLTREELNVLKMSKTSQFVISFGGIQYEPFAFTEQGVAMLSGVLKSPVAVQVNISIMRTFVAVRQLVLNRPSNKVDILEKEIEELRSCLEDFFTDQNDINEDTRMQIELINETLAKLQVRSNLTNLRKRIGYQLPGTCDEGEK